MSRQTTRIAGLALLVALALASTAEAQVDVRTLERGPWKKRDVPEGWILHQSKSYQIQSQAGMEKAKRLAAHMEAMLKVTLRLRHMGIMLRVI